MSALTKLTAASMNGKSKSAVVREILQSAGHDADVMQVIAELKRLSGEEISAQAVYTLRKEARDAATTNHKTIERRTTIAA